MQQPMRESLNLYPNLVINNELDMFWIKLISRIKKNESPYNTYIKDGFLYVKTDKEKLNLNKSSTEDLMHFFSQRLGISLEISKKDNWKELRKKAIRDKTIFHFANRIKNEYNLSEEKTRKLISQIHLNISLKKITPDDIVFNDENISIIDYINGFQFQNGNYVYNI